MADHYNNRITTGSGSHRCAAAIGTYDLIAALSLSALCFPTLLSVATFCCDELGVCMDV